MIRLSLFILVSLGLMQSTAPNQSVDLIPRCWSSQLSHGIFPHNGDVPDCHVVAAGFTCVQAIR